MIVRTYFFFSEIIETTAGLPILAVLTNASLYSFREGIENKVVKD